MPDEHKKDVESADQLWEAIKERAKKLQFGSFCLDIKVHAGHVREAEVSDVREKIRVDQ